MKKMLFSLMLIFVTITVFSQDVLNPVLEKRDSLYRKYRKHNDTVTIRTWVNVVRSNNYLRNILLLDSVILEKQIRRNESSGRVIDSLTGNLKTVRKENQRLKFEKNEDQLQALMYKRYFLLASVVALLFIILFLIVLIRLSKNKKTIRELDAQVREYYTQVHDANQQIEHFEKMEKHLASEINRVKTTLGKELKEAREAQAKAEDEKLMFENQISAVKKAYDMEVEKRKSVEEELREINNEFKNEIHSRKKIEEELSDLLERIRKGL